MAERAVISWVPFEEGGRAAPPTGPVYSTVARFEDDVDNWPRSAWSLVLRLVRPFRNARYQLAEVSFLNDAAPSHLLRRGSRFELLEGNRRVAKGVVVDPSAQIPVEMSEFESSLIR